MAGHDFPRVLLVLGTVKFSNTKYLFIETAVQHIFHWKPSSKNILSGYKNQLTLGAPTDALSGQIGSVTVAGDPVY